MYKAFIWWFPKAQCKRKRMQTVPSPTRECKVRCEARLECSEDHGNWLRRTIRWNPHSQSSAHGLCGSVICRESLENASNHYPPCVSTQEALATATYPSVVRTLLSEAPKLQSTQI